MQYILPVGFKLGVSFSPLHTDDHHPVENKEACYWNCPISKEYHYGEYKVHLVSTLKELGTDALTFFHPRLQGIQFSMTCCFLAELLLHHLAGNISGKIEVL